MARLGATALAPRAYEAEIRGASRNKEKLVATDRKLAISAGILFIVATVASLIATALVSPALNADDYLSSIATSESRVLLGSLFQFVGGVACPAIAIALYPVLRRYNEGLAIGSVGFRTIEGAMHVLIAVCYLLLVSLSKDFAQAGATSFATFQVVGAQLNAARDWLGMMSVLTFGIGGLMYYVVFYQARLVPRWLSAWGLVAVPMVMASWLLVMFGMIQSFSPTQIVLALPILVQEIVLAVWLIAKGFDAHASRAPAMDPGRLAPSAA